MKFSINDPIQQQVNEKLQKLEGKIQLLDERIDLVQHENANLLMKVNKYLLFPIAKSKILTLLRKSPDSPQRYFYPEFQGENQDLRFAFWKGWDELAKEKLIIPTSHGSGRRRTWRVNE